MSIAHAQSIFMPINVRALCTVIILSCHMLDPAVSSLVNGLVYVNGVDRADQYTVYYSFIRKSVKMVEKALILAL